MKKFFKVLPLFVLGAALTGCSVLGENAGSASSVAAVRAAAASYNGLAPEDIFNDSLNLGAVNKDSDKRSEATPFENVAQSLDEVGVVDGEEIAITVSFPFEDSMKGYSLLYIKAPEKAFMRLFDAKGNLVQEFGDMDIQGVPYFRYDNLVSGGEYKGFSVFDPEKSSEEYSGYYYILDENGKKFNFDAISVPAYEGLLEGTYNILLYTEERKEMSGSRDFYQVFWEAGKCPKVKRWEYEVAEGNYEKTSMRIFDAMEDKLIYEGPMELDNDLEPINQDFYKSMIINNLQVYAEDIPDEVIFYTGELKEKPQADKKTGSGEETEGEEQEIPEQITEEYKDLNECLKAKGLDEKSAIGEYVDEFGNKEFEVYYDTKSGQGLAVAYRWYYDLTLKKKASLEAFPIAKYERSKKTYSFQPMSLNAEERMSGYSKTSEYISGQLRNLEIRDFDRTMEDSPGYETLIRENFVYRDDGSLYYHGRSHNAYYYGIDYMAMNEKYDLSSRLVYSSALVMTGSNELYNFYEGDSKKIKYQIFLDKSDDGTVSIEINEVK
ncbi:MAG: hypothetical protein J6O71_04530 [Lachnospiraceae bacterium]|nr:hypothetical protein [Lachnospiraceae bacterium]